MSSLRATLFGKADQARRDVAFTLGRTIERDAQYFAALALAYAGDDGRAQALTDDLSKRYPEATIVRFNYLPTLRAKLAVNRRTASEAIATATSRIPLWLASG